MTMTASTLDTRTSYRRPASAAWRAEPSARPASASLNGATELTLFRRLVRDLISASHKERAECRAKVIEHLKATRYPSPAFNELLFQCAAAGGPDGLDIAIDVVAEVGPMASAYAWRLYRTDGPKWTPSELRRRVTDGIWYILLRGVAQSKAEFPDRFVPAATAIVAGTVSIREAGVRALGDMADREGVELKDLIRAVLRQVIRDEKAEEVKAAAEEVLASLEG